MTGEGADQLAKIEALLGEVVFGLLKNGAKTPCYVVSIF